MITFAEEKKSSFATPKHLSEVKKHFYKYGKERTLNDFNIKEATLERYLRETILPEQSWLITSDWHVPFHNVALTQKLYRLIDKNNFTGIVIAGDFLDMFSISAHAANSLAELENLTLGLEYEQGRAILDELDVHCKGMEKVLLYGNHENRWERFVKSGDNAKLKGALGNPFQGLKMSERKDWKVITEYPDGVFELGEHLEIIHGLYTNVHATKKHCEMSDRSVMFGHTHRVGTWFTEKRASYNIGGLFNKHDKAFNYMFRLQKKLWSNAFAVVHLDSFGYFYVDLIKCFQDSFVYNGEIY